MSKKHQKNQVNIFVGHNNFHPFTPKQVVSDVSMDSMISILQEVLDSPYADEDLLNHVGEFGRSLPKEEAEKARVALRAFL